MRDLIAKYRIGCIHLENCLDGVSQNAFEFRPGKDQWTICEILSHLVDAEVFGLTRAKKIIAENGSRVEVYNQEIWAEALSYEKMNSKDSLKLIKLLRNNLSQVLESISNDTWNNSVFHPEIGKLTLSDWIKRNCEHIEIHIRQISKLLDQWNSINKQATSQPKTAATHI